MRLEMWNPVACFFLQQRKEERVACKSMCQDKPPPQVSSTLVQGMMHAVSHAHSIFPQGQVVLTGGLYFLFFFLLPQTCVRQVCRFSCAAAIIY